MPRFVILTHDWPFLHWDFMLEQGNSLRTWRLLSEPCAGQQIEAEELPDHRLAYLDQTGPISGGRGTVFQWDTGTFQNIEDSEAGLRILLAGHKFQGEVQVVRQQHQLTIQFTENKNSGKVLPRSPEV